MSKKFARVILLTNVAVLAMAMSGCETPKVPLYYQGSYSQGMTQGIARLHISPVEDARKGSRELDAILSEPPTSYLNQILKQEMERSGLFSVVTSTTPMKEDSLANVELTESQSNAGKLRMNATLLELRMDSPEKDEIGMMKGATMGFGLLGGIAYAIYATQDTDIFGKAILKVELVDEIAGTKLVETTYTGKSKERVIRGDVELYEVQSKVVGKAVADIMTQLKPDVVRVLQPGPATIAPATSRAHQTSVVE